MVIFCTVISQMSGAFPVRQLDPISARLLLIHHPRILYIMHDLGSSSPFVTTFSMSTRSHQGCWTCKRRRRRCDNTHPKCENCVQRGVECEGYELRLRWGSGIASRGRFTGADKPLEDSVPPRPSGRKRDLSKRTRVSKKTISNHLSQGLRHVVQHCSSDGACNSRRPDLSNTLGYFPTEPQRPRRDEAIFREFMNSGLNVLHSTRAGDSLLQPRLPQLCRESRALYTICLAFQLSLGTTQSREFFEYFDKALREFRSELAQSTTLPDGTLLSGLLLCSIGLMHGLPWTMHLEGMHNILQSHDLADPHSLAIDNSFRVHLFEVMGIMDLPYFSVGRQTPTIGLWNRYCQQFPKNDGPEPMSGLPRTLIDLYAGIGTGTTEQSLWDWPGERGSFLQNYLWEAHRLAGILVLRRMNRANHRDSQGDLTMSKWRQPNECPATETVLVGKILANLDALRLACTERPTEDKHIRNAILFPVFHAGLEASVLSENPNWKDTIQSCLLGSHQGTILLDLLREMWQSNQKHLSVEDLARSRGVEMGLL